MFTSISLGMQPQGQPALPMMPSLLEPRAGQGSSWCCMPSSGPGRGRWRNRNTSHLCSLPHLRTSSSPRGEISRRQLWSCWDRCWQSLAVHDGGRVTPMEPAALSRRLLHNPAFPPRSWGCAPTPAQRGPRFLCALQRACRYSERASEGHLLPAWHCWN